MFWEAVHEGARSLESSGGGRGQGRLLTTDAEKSEVGQAMDGWGWWHSGVRVVWVIPTSPLSFCHEILLGTALAQPPRLNFFV